jgi:glucans biosynthesis protein
MRPPAVSLSLALLLTPLTAEGFDLGVVADLARTLSRSEHADPRGAVPEWLTSISYDEYRDIRFRSERSLWRGTRSPFEVQFFHPGLFYDRPVRIHEIDEKGAVRELTFSPDAFDYGPNDFSSRVPPDLGWAGFRVHSAINRSDYKDEVLVFLGATYLRGVARGQVFGLSARGLAIDTGLPSGEEFPRFREFWLERPKARARSLVIYALLDSPRATGAFRFELVPGAKTMVAVDAKVFLRQPVAKLGLAPLTSMFFSGENRAPERRDYRPEVHDSDGLLVHETDRIWWRPLSNPNRLRVTGFLAPRLFGFGLLQRDRNFDHYQDFETRAERRPSAWVEPLANWPAGHVELIEIPTPSEQNDNIVAFWAVDRPPESVEPLAFSYALSFIGGEPLAVPLARVVATRLAEGRDGAVRYLVDFAGPELAAIPAGRVLEGVVELRPPEAATLLDQQVAKNPVTGGWRLVFQLRVNDAVRVTAELRAAGEALTERWSEDVAP